ncbi:hypothetical protein M7I_3316 [Glarea lozoyensis 74030]|uniref:Rhodopsin domain-containing protein n=1 Tax=Glarea lozoyensis (strain ATCC 74030 / MF5533) TaxID=1104152 RepID=H0EL57_GLAL7|nr:hypothetical protein M7I_3316 [Glarea lozoyensis 74030]
MMNTFALGGVVIWAVFSSGMGHYAAELSATELQNALKLIPAAYVTWTLGTTSFKLSVLCLYTRIFSIKAFKTLSYVTMGLTVSTIGIMIWRIVDLVKNADADFVYNMPTLALTTTLELTYITPALTKMTGSRKTISARSNPRNIVTFGGGRGRRQTSYINMMGSQDPIKADIGDIEREAKDNAFREDAFTTTLISSSPQPDIRLETLSTKNAIRVRHEFHK